MKTTIQVAILERITVHDKQQIHENNNQKKLSISGSFFYAFLSL